MENIISSSKLKNNYSLVSKLCKYAKQPVYITNNGKKDTVIIDIEEFNKMTSELELLNELALAQNDVINGRLSPIEDTLFEMRELLN